MLWPPKISLIIPVTSLRDNRVRECIATFE